MSLDEITRQFDLTRVQKNPAIFDNAKLAWMNRSYINKTAGDSLVDRAKQFFVDAGLVPAQLDQATRSWLAQVIDLVKTHVDHLDQLPNQTDIIYGFETNPPEIDPAIFDVLRKPEARAVAREFARLVEEKEILTAETYREIVGQVKTATHQKGRNLFHPIRAALTGRDSGPELEKLIPLYEEGSRLNLPGKVMSCRERLQIILRSI
jgi:glutamyl/glutaminyl-tRNA synthetase